MCNRSGPGDIPGSGGLSGGEKAAVAVGVVVGVVAIGTLIWCWQRRKQQTAAAGLEGITTTTTGTAGTPYQQHV